MKEFHYVISDVQGLHARNAMQLAKAAEAYQCFVSMVCGEKAADVKNIISLMSVTARQGDSVLFRLEGTDEDQACPYLESLVKVIL